MKHILIVGAGQLGSRHLQGLVQSKLALNITVVDPFTKSLVTAKTRADEIVFGNKETSIQYLKEIQHGTFFDVGIIATTANVRFKVFQNLISKCSVRNIIFEKVLFQKESEYEEVGKQLISYNMNAWVNCPRRIFPAYKSLKSLLENEINFDVNVKGSNWGLACNGIHFIDLFSYLTGNRGYQLDSALLDESVIESKRSGFFEVNGTLKGHDGNGNTFELCCDDSEGVSLSVNILTPNYKVLINEADGEFIVIHDGQETAEPYKPLFQSQLTNLIVEEIIESGESSLTSFSESKGIHLPFIRTIKAHLEKSLNENLEACPIT